MFIRQKPGGSFGRWRRVQELTAETESGSAIAVGQESEVSNLDEPGRQHVEQEAANELGGGQGHRFDVVVILRVPPTKADLALVETEESAIGEGDAVGIAG